MNKFSLWFVLLLLPMGLKAQEYWLFELGTNVAEHRTNLVVDLVTTPPEYQGTGLGINWSLSNFRQVSENINYGLGVEYYQVAQHNLLVFKPVDVKYHMFSDWYSRFTFGAGRLSGDTPATGYVGGISLGKQFGERWEVNMRMLFVDHLARDQIHINDDPDNNRNSFVNMRILALNVGWRF